MTSSDAATQVISLLVAGLVLATAVGTVMVVTYSSHDDATQSGERSNLNARAASVASILLDSPGHGWYGGASSCVDTKVNDDAFDPDDVSRFALGYDGCNPLRASGPGVLGFNKLADLERGLMEADPSNDHLDYEEARQALGLDEEYLDFHLRTAPVLLSVRQLMALGYKDPNIRPAYVGNYEVVDAGGGAEGSLLDVDAGVVELEDEIVFYAEITNNGLTTTVFETQFDVPLADRTVELVRHTPDMPPASTYNVTVTVPKTSDWAWSSSSDVAVLVSDPLRVLYNDAINATGLDVAGSQEQELLSVHAGKIQYEISGSDPKVYYEAWDGRGNEVAYSDWQIEIYDSLGLLIASDSTLQSRGWESFVLPLPDVYTVKLKTLSGVELAESKILVVDAELGGFSTLLTQPEEVPAESVAVESAFIELLVEHYEDGPFDPQYDSTEVPYVIGGDIYPDLKTVMNNDLRDKLMDDQGTQSPSDDEPTLANYNVLVIGSNVDHQVMTSQAAKDAIRDWVFGGGLLIAMGSYDQSVQWLQPIFHSAIDSASGGISAPDENHPVLDTPNTLDWKAFDSHDVVWSFTRDQDEDHFTHVVRQGDDDILALSDHGEFGEGRVLLSAWQAWDMLDGEEPASCDPASLTYQCPGLMLTHNLITLHFRALEIDYGPPIPEDRAQGVAHRVASVYHPELGRAVTLEIEVFVF